MAVIDTTRTQQTGNSIGHVFFKLANAIATWREVRTTRKALSHLTDRELSDIGLSRADIENIR